METIEVFVERIIYRAESAYTVLLTKYGEQELTVVGMVQEDLTGQMVKLEGKMGVHSSFGKQFEMRTYEIIEPTDEESIQRYLSSGAIKGIGESLARRIVNAFGADTLRVIEQEPECLAKVKGISLRKAQEIAVQVEEKKDLRSALMFLQKFGITNKLAVKIYENYGHRVYGVMKENPYKLAEDIEGIGFVIADKIAMQIGIHTDSDYRIRSGILYTLTRGMSEGNTYLPKEVLLESAAELLQVPAEAIKQQLGNLAMDKKLMLKKDYVYSMPAYYAEKNVAFLLGQMLEDDLDIKDEEIEYRIRKIEDKEKMELDPLQRQAVAESMKNGVFLLTGGPGTGKTTTINTMIRSFLQMGYNLELAAPTGRAAKRMTEATGYEARTIHRMLEVGGNPEMEGSFFDRDENNPLDADVVIIDEMSMVDIFLFQSLLKAIPAGARLILVGDMNQLPSVGPGQVMKDLVDSGIFPCVKLQKIFRQAGESDIVQNAHHIKNGESVVLDNKSKDFFFVPRADVNQIYNNIVQLVTDKLPRYVGGSVQDVQVLTPMKKGPLGAENLNPILQKYVNPPDASKKEHAFGDKLLRVGDRVMQTKNNYDLPWEIVGKYNIVVEKGEGVFNGDVGKIVEFQEYSKLIKIEFDDQRIVHYPFESIEDLELAYAITIHKSQGSEYPAVVMPLLGVPKLLQYRNLLYTGITRAKKCVTILGSEQVIADMIQNENGQTRYSGLKDFLLALQ